ncbi:cytochrome c biogenesis CcdA family protein [Alkalispirochaeta alkalica]|uniref:cytochrome c biogenesis CcdA family protein n=1 Tax=Alkalispirochaeta alkalica TaxID=46356 RepID=UPI000370614A|nr:cytochrome c biogenesis protein CcdA [Alkalispirochaeta alkalica]
MVGDLSLAAATATALAAGFVSFLSPCVFPLVPSYLSFISGSSFSDLSRGATATSLILTRTIAFVLGFSAVFVSLGILFSGPTIIFATALPWINLVAGAVLVFFGVTLIFSLPLFLERLLPRRLRQPPAKPASAGGSLLAGAAFGAGWTPCIGPLLGSILFLAGSGGDPARAALLLGAYSLGLGLPFIAGGMMFSRLVTRARGMSPHLGKIRRTSGFLLVVLGILIGRGQFQQINATILSAGFRLHQWGLETPQEAQRIFSLGLLLLALLCLLPLVAASMRARRREDDPAPRRRVPGRFALVSAGLALILFATAGLQAAGILQAELLLSRWLLFQGL